MQVHVDILVGHRDAETIDEVRGAGGTDGHHVAIVHDTVAVDVLILDVAHFHLSELLNRTVVDISLILEETDSDEASFIVSRSVDQ